MNQENQLSLEELNCDHFTESVGTDFQATIEGQSFGFQLIEAQEHSSEMPGSSRKPFSLLFQAPPGTSFPQGMYELSHETIGTLALFLSPVGQTDQGMQLEAVFN